jgi:hypothetical protein
MNWIGLFKNCSIRAIRNWIIERPAVRGNRRQVSLGGHWKGREWVGTGFVFGRNSRLMFPCVVTYRGISRWVFFLADTGALRTYLSTEVLFLTMIASHFDCSLARCLALRGTILLRRWKLRATPQLYDAIRFPFRRSRHLGTDFMTNYNVVMWPDWDSQKVAFLFGRDWNFPVRKNLKWFSIMW